MASIYTKCPKTGQAIPTGIDIDPASLPRIPEFQSTVVCNHCGETHHWSRASAWVHGADGVLRPWGPAR